MSLKQLLLPTVNIGSKNPDVVIRVKPGSIFDGKSLMMHPKTVEWLNFNKFQFTSQRRVVLYNYHDYIELPICWLSLQF